MASEQRRASVTSLYIANLHPDVSEVMLYEKFRPAGPILSIRVCRDPVTRRSYGYAYINFQCAVDAQRVVDTMNYDVLCGRPLRIMWSVHDPSLYKSGVFIRNLASTITNDSLHEAFSAYGKILCVKVNGDEWGSGFVHFESPEAAQEAIEKMNGSFLKDCKISVTAFKSRSKRMLESTARTSKEFTNIYIKNFGEEMDERQLKELFDGYGPLLSVKVMTDELGKSKGFGFINFEKPQDAQKAVEEMNGTDMNGNNIYVGRAQKRVERQQELKRRFEQQKKERIARSQGANLYVKNLHLGIDDDRLQKEFSVFGTITSAKVMMEDGRSKGFGFVCFSSPLEATRALKEMNGKILAMKPLYVSLAQRKEERKTLLTDQYMERLAMGRVAPNIGSPYQLPPFSTMAFPSSSQIHASYYKSRQIRPNPPWKSQNNRLSPIQNMPGGIQASAPRPSFATIKSADSGVLSSPQTMGVLPAGSTATSPSVRQYKYNAGARNLQQNLNNPQRVSVQPAAVHVQEQGPLTPTVLSSASPEEQKDMLGEHLYSLVHALQPTMSAKLTGMLLELDNSELLHLLESPESLRAMVDEAVHVLQSHWAKEAGAV